MAVRQGTGLGIVTAILLGLAATTAPARAAAPPLAPGTKFRVYRLLEVPVPAGTPASARPYATLAGIGNGNRLGDPALLHDRAGVNARQEWWFAPIHYPDNTVTGVPVGVADLLKRCFYYYVIPHCNPFNLSFGAPPSTVTVRSKIVSRYSGKCLTVSGSSLQPSPVVQDTCVAGARDQIWSFVVSVQDADSAYAVYEVALEPLSNNQTCLGPPVRTIGQQLRLLGEDVACPLWILRPAVRDYRQYPAFEHEF